MTRRALAWHLAWIAVGMVGTVVAYEDGSEILLWVSGVIIGQCLEALDRG